MAEPDLNPYAAPQRTESPISKGISKWHRPSIILLLAATGHGGFTFVLLTASSPTDVIAGRLFLINCVWLLIGTCWSSRTVDKYRPAVVLFVAAVVQFSIMAYMLVTDIGDGPDVMLINGIISGGLLLACVIQSVWVALRTSKPISGNSS